MIEYSAQVNNMCPITKGPKHGPAPIPEEGQWVKAYKIEDISGYTHGVGWCAPQQGTCKLSLNIKNGIIEEALVEPIGCSGMHHSAAMAGEILPGIGQADLAAVIGTAQGPHRFHSSSPLYIIRQRAGAGRRIPVSYTHLDVYKRQGCSR